MMEIKGCLDKTIEQREEKNSEPYTKNLSINTSECNFAVGEAGRNWA